MAAAGGAGGVRPFSNSLYVGDQRAEVETLTEIFGVEVKVHPRALTEKEIVWLRDESVRAYDGTHLVGQPLSLESRVTLQTLLPPCAEGFIPNLKCRGTGRGYGKEFSQETHLKELTSLHIPARATALPIEGGNVRMMGEKALVGFNTIMATRVAMIEAGTMPEIVPVDEPTREALFAARNEQYVDEQVASEKLSKEIMMARKDPALREQSYRLTTQLQEDDRRRRDKHGATYKDLINKPLEGDSMRERACQITAELKIAEGAVRDELGVESVIVLPQREMHIDLEVIPLAKRNIVLVQNNSDAYTEHGRRLCKAITDAGLKALCVEARATDGRFEMNLMNSLVLPDGRLAVPVVPRKLSTKEREFAEALPVDVVFFEMPNANLIRENGGGFRCMSMWG